MLVLTYYKIKKTPKEKRKIPGSIAGIIDATIFFSTLKVLVA